MSEITNDEPRTIAEMIPESNNANLASRSIPVSSVENKNIHDFITQVESDYRGLGIPVLYGVLSILANKSVFYVGGRGVGKTRTIKCIPDMQGTIASKWDAFTLDELNTLCGQHINGTHSVHDKHFVFRVGEFSALSEYHKEVFLTVCSRISADDEYHHVTTTLQHLNIENCKLTMLIAIQPINYSRLCNYYSQWESMSSDRFSKFLLFNPLRRGNTVEVRLVPTLPTETPPSATLPQDIDLRRLVTLFSSQISEGRALLYAKDYAIAMARFQGRSEASQNDVDTFYMLFSPYLDSFSRLQERESFEESVTVHSGHIELLTQIGKHLEGITKQELCESLRLSERHIERCACSLLEKKLIREEEGRYHLSSELEQFFNWYKDSFSLQMSPSPISGATGA